ncbi:MAG: peptide ABC transporter substrate-binding protein [Zetaproteobacteria bacterium]|nr:peptide ABC transporter substrate-binding protein [Pseudobdellovibrionaceae bacterium]
MPSKTILEVNGLKKHFPVYSGFFKRQVAVLPAVDGVSFRLSQGQTLGLVGESGCGKSTLGRSILRLIEPTAGEVIFEGSNLLELSNAKMRLKRKDIQMIFQDPYASLNPRMSVLDLLSEPFIVHGLLEKGSLKAKVLSLLDEVGLHKNCLEKYSHEFSGGQRQRIGIARALALNPKLIIADEPVSALDVSIQSQILNLMVDLRKKYNLSYVFIAHDLAVIQHISDMIAVMYLGKFVEFTSKLELYKNPKHPYTKILIDAIPQPVYNDQSRARQKQVIIGDVPSATNPPPGCPFHPRCPIAQDRCKKEAPKLQEYATKESSHMVACHYA